MIELADLGDVKREMYPLGQFDNPATKEAHELVTEKAATWLRDPDVNAIDLGHKLQDGKVIGRETWVWVGKKGDRHKRIAGHDLGLAYLEGRATLAAEFESIKKGMRKVDHETGITLEKFLETGINGKKKKEAEAALQTADTAIAIAKTAKEKANAEYEAAKGAAAEDQAEAIVDEKDKELKAAKAEKKKQKLIRETQREIIKTKEAVTREIAEQSAAAKKKTKVDGSEMPFWLDKPGAVHLWRYDKPWIRVHINRKLECNRLKEKPNYARELLFAAAENGEPENAYYVTVVEALYKTMEDPTHEVPPIDDIAARFAEAVEKLSDRSTSRAPFEILERALEYVKNNLDPRHCVKAKRDRRVEPLIGGVGIGNAQRAGGTLGSVVWDRTTGSAAILGNCHVLAGGVPRLNEPCLQPAMSDGGTVELDTVATLARWCLTDRVDSAVAILNGRRGYAASSLLGIGSITGVLRACKGKELEHCLLGLKLQKSGRATCRTEGFVDGVGMAVKLEYPDGPMLFYDQIHIVPAAAADWNGEPKDARQEVSKAGDSGAVWVDRLGRAVGLHFAGDSTASEIGDFALANRMVDVVDELDISLTPVFRRPEEVLEAERESLAAASANGHGSVAELDFEDGLASLIRQLLAESDAPRVLSRVLAGLGGPQPRPAESAGGG